MEKNHRPRVKKVELAKTIPKAVAKLKSYGPLYGWAVPFGYAADLRSSWL